MKPSRKAIIALILLGISLIIHLYSRNETRVENGYSRHLFLKISNILRTGLGGLSFSFGDILYGLAVIWIAWKLFRLIRFIRSKKHDGAYRAKMNRILYKTFIIACSLYILFNFLWGINYNRQGIAWQLGLEMKKYSREEVREINCLLIEKINGSKKVLLKNKTVYPSNAQLFRMTTDAYKNIAGKYPFLEYQPASIKPSIWGWLGNYTGFTGYYNPFTGEAQVNTTVPEFSQPYTACHEVAHQIGYAKEMEANFVGYLAAAASNDTLFHYSVYLDLFTYANRNLHFTDSLSAMLYRRELIPEVIADLNEWIIFSKEHKNPVGPVVRWMYGKFLQGNQQPQGILSYDEVTAFIISYYKKFGMI